MHMIQHINTKYRFEPDYPGVIEMLLVILSCHDINHVGTQKKNSLQRISSTLAFPIIVPDGCLEK